MDLNKMHLAFFAMAIGCNLICKAENGVRLLTTNTDWHITSGSSSNAPFWLVPSNAWVRFLPLKNGQWLWTTNMDARMLDDRVIDLHGIDFDVQKESQVERQEQQRMFDSGFPGVVHVLEYGSGHRWNTNMADNWWGMWVEDTNTGWRVNVCPVRSNAVDEAVIIKVGSIVTNSGVGLLPSPDCKNEKLELIDSNGIAVPTRRGAAAKLYDEKYAMVSGAENQVVNKHTPSGGDATVERNYPDTLSDLEYPRWNVDGDRQHIGSFFRFAGFVSNGPPCHIGFIRFNDIYSIRTAGEYTLTVQPVLYRMHYDGGTFQGYLDRVDLPCVTTKVHLVPNAK